MSKTLLIGSSNLDKAAELNRLLDGLDWEVKSLRDYPPVEEPEETEKTFEANALLKARYYSARFGVPCVADDSGLEVDALNGDPGVYSARYAGEDCTYDDNNAKLLDALKDVPDDKRGARFVCCAALVLDDGQYIIERGEMGGRILRRCRGKNGFGYDPLFVPEGHEKTYAEMTADEKHVISHRAIAFNKMRDRLKERS